LRLFLSWAGCWFFLASAPAQSLELFHFEEPAMGTLFRIEVYAPSRGQAAAAAAAAWHRVRELDDIFSDYKPDSELMRFCHQPAGTKTPISADLYAILIRSGEITQASHGAFDVTVGPLKRLWRQSCRDGRLPSAMQLSTARALTGWDKVQLNPEQTASLAISGMRLDLGGIAKGYAADATLKVLRERGLERALVAASGDVVAGESPPGQLGWRIGVASLSAPTSPETTVILRHRAISTSGDTVQFAAIGGTTYSHILDPKSGLGLTVRRFVNVIAPSSVQADALATALSVAGPEGVTLPPGVSFRFEERADPQGNGDARVVLKDWPHPND